MLVQSNDFQAWVVIERDQNLYQGLKDKQKKSSSMNMDDF